MNDREKDDAKTGRLLSRREAMACLGAVAGAGGFTSIRSILRDSTPACIGKPEQTEGPYFVDLKLNRSDIRADPTDGSVREGVPLGLRFVVWRITSKGCVPFQGATVDLWHCDANGIYSDVRDFNFNTVGKKFLRGYQTVDAAGEARFLTVFPGWYPGRAVHMHFKIRTDIQPAYSFTSQLYFEDSFSDLIYKQEPYSKRASLPIRNQDDFIFIEGGKDLTLFPVREGSGCSASFEIGLPIA
jgi:protocatechuate 3,4-dioxygenase beta subunit